MAKVKFYEGTKSEYLSLSVPRNDTALYFCNDTKEMFKGDNLLTDGVRITLSYEDLPVIDMAADGVIYYTLNEKTGYLLNAERTNWIPIFFQTVTDVDTVAEKDVDKVIPTVGALLKAIQNLTNYMPIASNEGLGLVKSSSEILVNEDGEMSISEIEMDKVMGLNERLMTLEDNFNWQEI